MERFRPSALAIAFGVAAALLGGVAGSHLRGEPAAPSRPTSPRPAPPAPSSSS